MKQSWNREIRLLCLLMEDVYKRQEYKEIPLDDLSGKEVPNQPEIRAQQMENTAAARGEKKA